MPASAMPMVMSVVATGRLIKGDEIVMLMQKLGDAVPSPLGEG
jgi:hypothetical protein